jgi:hypothetical protein
MYPDTHRTKDGRWDPLPTTGIGTQFGEGPETQRNVNSFGLSLPWKTATGNYVRESAIVKEWERLRGLGLIGSGFAYESKAKLFLDQDVVQWCFETDTILKWASADKTFPNTETWPASAQLAFMDMLWWMGASFFESWPKLSAALHSEDFFTAARECVSVAKADRDYEHQQLFTNAGKVVAAYIDKEHLWMPKDVVIPITPLGAETYPALVVIKASQIANTPTKFNLQAWYVQRMLKRLGFYTGAVDGLWGSVSAKAMNAFVVDAKHTGGLSAANLKLLSAKSRFFLDVV